ncbi:hypothetical protein ACFYM2_32700 [Streptomyces sp. NPDC006711]|uniref:hypothetical protein n=1 Tax=Streptomyces sp. NPDC006711 TaxID=3364762 RepID=UPI00367908E9
MSDAHRDEESLARALKRAADAGARHTVPAPAAWVAQRGLRRRRRNLAALAACAVCLLAGSGATLAARLQESAPAPPASTPAGVPPVTRPGSPAPPTDQGSPSPDTGPQGSGSASPARDTPSASPVPGRGTPSATPSASPPPRTHPALSHRTDRYASGSVTSATVR